MHMCWGREGTWETGGRQTHRKTKGQKQREKWEQGKSRCSVREEPHETFLFSISGYVFTWDLTRVPKLGFCEFSL